MMTHNRLLPPILIICILLLTRCVPDGSQPAYRFWFGIIAEPYPYRLDYATQDTLWINITSLDKSLYDTISGKIYRFDSTGFYSALSVKDAEYKHPDNKGQVASFIYPDDITGSTLINDSSSTAEVMYGCASPNYGLKLGIVFLRKGVFDISFATKHILDCPVEYNDLESATYHFLVTDTHLSYYQQLPWDSLGKQPDRELTGQLENKTAFIVHVQ